MAMAKKRKKRKAYTVLRFRKNDPAHNLAAAAQQWAISQGCPPVLIGGIAVMYEGTNRYRICVVAIGDVPKKPEPVHLWTNGEVIAHDRDQRLALIDLIGEMPTSASLYESAQVSRAVTDFKKRVIEELRTYK